MKRHKILMLLGLTVFILLLTVNHGIKSSTFNDNNRSDDISMQIDTELAEMEVVFNDYDNWLFQEITKTGTVGAAVAVVYKDRTAFMKCYGKRKFDSDEPVDENTVFRLASVSKPVTGILTGILAQEKIIDFDETVKSSIPGFRLMNNTSAGQMTIRNLLTHSTGMVPHAYDDLVEAHVPFSQIFNRLNQANVTALPGQVYGYQNVMFSIIDTILAVKTSKNYSHLVKEKLFEPLGMENASTDFSSFRDNPNKAHPHQGGAVKKVIPLNNRYYTTAPAAGVNASISDIAKLMKGFINSENSVLEDEFKTVVFTPQIVTPLSRGYFKYWDNVTDRRYGIGWRLVNYKDRKIAYHGGYVRGYRAEIALSLDEEIGVVYLSNSPDSVASKSVPVFLNMFFEHKENSSVIVDSEIEDTDSKKQGS